MIVTMRAEIEPKCTRHHLGMTLHQFGEPTGLMMRAYTCNANNCTQAYNSSQGYFDIVNDRVLLQREQQDCHRCELPMYLDAANSDGTANGSGWYVELRRAKTGTAVSCPIPNDLGKAFHAFEGGTPFWSGKSNLEDLTKNWRKIYTRVFKTAGIDGHPHQFRHTAAKRLLVAGLSVAHVATLLANSETIVRKHYSKWIPERQQAFDSAIRSTWTG